MHELQVRVDNQLGKIEFNFEELRDNLSAMMKAYEGVEFTEETSSIAKKESATLKKIKKALSDRRIEVKKEYMKPYDDFEIKVKELTALIDKPILLIDTQVKAFDEKKKAEKKEKIKELYADLIGDLEEYIPLSKIYNSKWENLSTSMKSVQEELETVISSTSMAVDTIKGMNSEVVEKALTQYKQDLSLANAISYINKHEQIKAEILAKEEQKRKEEEERKRRAEEERIREEERKRVAEEERIKEEARQKAIEEERQRVAEEEAKKVETEPAEEVIPEPSNDEPEGLEDAFNVNEEPFEVVGELPFVTVGEVKAIFTVVATYEEIEEVEYFMNSIGVTWERNDD